MNTLTHNVSLLLACLFAFWVGTQVPECVIEEAILISPKRYNGCPCYYELPDRQVPRISDYVVIE